MIQDKKVAEVKRLIGLNEDSRQYFYINANVNSLKWLWENGFFDVLKKKAEDPSRMSWKTPELGYLVRMAKINPELVTEIIFDTPISKESFNPEVISQFLHICSYLPGDQLARLIGKIKTERWPALMQDHDQWGMDYGKMFDSLEKSGKHDSVVELASAVLELRNDLEVKINEEYFSSTPFCLANLSYSKVFYYLFNVDEPEIETVLDLAISILKKLTTPLDKDQKTSSVFSSKDLYSFFDLDIFTIAQRSEYHGSGESDVREVITLIKILAERILSGQCKEFAEKIYDNFFDQLPDSWLMWRIRLFILSLCPLKLLSQVTKTLFRIFREEDFSKLLLGTEYLKTLKKTFSVMPRSYQIEFINLTKELLSPITDDEEGSDKKRYGSRIFSVIGEYLLDDQIAELNDIGFEIDPTYNPEPMIGMGEWGPIHARGPISKEEFHKLSVKTIIEKLIDIWSPIQLAEQDKKNNFYNPLNAEGMGKLIKEDVKTRLSEYLNHSNEFLDWKKIDLHYLYSLLSGFKEAIDGISEPLLDKDWILLITLCSQLIQIGKEIPIEHYEYEKNNFNAWLGRWNAVCSAMVNLLIKTLSTKGIELGFEWKSRRESIISIIDYLFEYPDPIPEDEKLESARMTESVGFQNPQISDPYTLAINSIRGQAFKLFIRAVDLETENKSDLVNFEISKDLRLLYEHLLTKESTRAIMFLFGLYLPFLYSRDNDLIINNLAGIFKTEEGKEYLYLAAWEGYLTSNLYKELFIDEEFQDLYFKAIGLNIKNYPNQKHFVNPDEGLAHHFALAYMNLDFSFGNELFEYFWESGTIEQHISFVDRLGRSFITSENPAILEFFKTNEEAKRKLKEMWTWLLDSNLDPLVFREIGFWISLDKEIFQAVELADYLLRTLKKTEGYLKWDIGLRENIVKLTKGSPEDTLEIARLFLLEGGVRKKVNSLYFHLDEKWIDAFRILYTNPTTKQGTDDLINNLIREGGRLFWPLKEVRKNS